MSSWIFSTINTEFDKTSRKANLESLKKKYFCFNCGEVNLAETRLKIKVNAYRLIEKKIQTKSVYLYFALDDSKHRTTPTIRVTPCPTALRCDFGSSCRCFASPVWCKVACLCFCHCEKSKCRPLKQNSTFKTSVRN